METVKTLPFISFIIPTHNRVEKLLRLISSIEKSYYDKSRMEIIIIDDASTDNTSEVVKDKYGNYNNLMLLGNSKSELVSKSRNRGIKQSKGEYIFFVDDDVYLDSDTLPELVKYFQENRNTGALGPLICEHNDHGKVWSAGARMNIWTGIAAFPYKGRQAVEIRESIIECDCLLTSFMIRKKVIQQAGYFNSELFPFFHEELDFCMRLRFLGYKNFCLPSAEVWHDRSTGSLANKYEIYYYGTRSIIIAQALWSKNIFQYFISKLFAVMIPFCVNLIKNLYNKNTYPKKISTMLKGIKDGLKISRQVDSYKKLIKQNKNIGFFE